MWGVRDLVGVYQNVDDSQFRSSWTDWHAKRAWLNLVSFPSWFIFRLASLFSFALSSILSLSLSFSLLYRTRERERKRRNERKKKSGRDCAWQRRPGVARKGPHYTARHPVRCGSNRWKNTCRSFKDYFDPDSFIPKTSSSLALTKDKSTHKTLVTKAKYRVLFHLITLIIFLVEWRPRRRRYSTVDHHYDNLLSRAAAGALVGPIPPRRTHLTAHFSLRSILFFPFGNRCR